MERRTPDLVVRSSALRGDTQSNPLDFIGFFYYLNVLAHERGGRGDSLRQSTTGRQKKEEKKKDGGRRKHIVGLFMRPLLSQQIRRHMFRCRKIHVNLWFPTDHGGTYALCLGVFVCLFKGTVHSKLKFHPWTPQRCVDGGSGGVPHNRSGFSRWERIALNGHLLWPSKKKKKT